MIGHVTPGRRLRSIGWIALLGLCAALLMALTFRVNALKSEVRLAENRIVNLKREKLYLETEFETRSSQQQLKAWNDVEFGYVAPGSSQYLENERQVAMLGRAPGPDAPRPIRVASADDSVVAAAAFPEMVSPIAGALLGDDKPAEAEPARAVDRAAATAALGERLVKVERPRSAADDDADRNREKPASEKKRASTDKAATKTGAGKTASGSERKTAEKPKAATRTAATATRSASASRSGAQGRSGQSGSGQSGSGQGRSGTAKKEVRR